MGKFLRKILVKFETSITLKSKSSNQIHTICCGETSLGVERRTTGLKIRKWYPKGTMNPFQKISKK